MSARKKAPKSAKGARISKSSTGLGERKFERAESVISRRNQNGTVILMEMNRASFFHKLDEIAADVWTCMESPRTLSGLTAHFSKSYPSRAATLRRDIEALLDVLVRKGLLRETKAAADKPFPSLALKPRKPASFGGLQEFDLEQIESEVLNESVYLDVFAGSDLRLKKDVKPIRNALAKVAQLEGVTHRWRKGVLPAGLRSSSGTVRAGLIAQQVATQMPELVRTDARTGYLAVEYQKLNSYLVEAIKELRRTLLAQEGRIEKLETLMGERAGKRAQARTTPA
jgi:hypothetical protein